MESSNSPGIHNPLTNERAWEYNVITLLVGRREQQIRVCEYYIHLSPILTQRCCGSLYDPEEPNIIRLPEDNPETWIQLLDCLYTQNLLVRINPARWIWNPFTADSVLAPSSEPGGGYAISSLAHLTTDEDLRRTQLAINNIAVVYSMALKYQFQEVQVQAIKKTMQYLDPEPDPDAFLWQMALTYEDVPGASQALRPYLKRALLQLGKKAGQGQDVLRYYFTRQDDFSMALWRFYNEKDDKRRGQVGNGDHVEGNAQIKEEST